MLLGFGGAGDREQFVGQPGLVRFWALQRVRNMQEGRPPWGGIAAGGMGVMEDGRMKVETFND
jgi:hypothetical protein